MRKIKFRAWDTENKCWFPRNIADEWINICPDGEVIFGDADGDPELSEGRFEISQFTGMTDMDDKEIYEGDIVHVYRFKTHDPDDGTMEKLDSPQIVSWICTMATPHWALTHPQIENLEYVGGYDRLSVIGNIWENPELVKEKSDDQNN